MYCIHMGISDEYLMPMLLIGYTVHVTLMRRVPAQYIKQSPVRRQVLHAEVKSGTFPTGWCFILKCGYHRLPSYVVLLQDEYSYYKTLLHAR